MADDNGTRNPKYKAFVSYKHSVMPRFVPRLEQALKRYAKPLLTKPLRIFRDENHLVPGHDLPQLIRDALEDSEFLILIASPKSAESPWVKTELDVWCNVLNRTDRLIIVFVEGEIATRPNTMDIDWERTSALPAILKPVLARMPLYVDLRWIAADMEISEQHPQFKRAVNTIVARLRGVDPNELIGQEILQHRRNLRLRNFAIAALLLLTSGMVAATAIAIAQRRTAEEQRVLANEQQLLANERRIEVAMSAASLEFEQGRVARAVEMSGREPGVPESFLRNLETALREVRSVVSSEKGSDFDVNEMIAVEPSTIVTMGWYDGLNVVRPAGETSKEACGGQPSRFSHVTISDHTDLAVLVRDQEFAVYRLSDCEVVAGGYQEDAGSAFGKVTSAAVSPGSSRAFIAVEGGVVYQVAPTNRLIYGAKDRMVIRRIVVGGDGGGLALIASNGTMRLIDERGSQMARDIKMPMNGFEKVSDALWLRFLASLRDGDRVQIMREPLGTIQGSQVLVFHSASPQSGWIGAIPLSDSLLDARLVASASGSCAQLEWIEDDSLSRRTIDPACSRDSESDPETQIRPHPLDEFGTTTSGAFCGAGDVVALGTYDGNIMWFRYVRARDMFIAEHVENAWSDSVLALACMGDHTLYAGFRVTGIKAYEDPYVVTVQTTSDELRMDSRLSMEEHKIVQRLIRRPAGDLILRIDGDAGDVYLERKDDGRVLWMRSLATTVPYRTGEEVDPIDAMAVDERRARVWVLTAHGKLSVMDLHSGTLMATIGTAYYAGRPAISVGLSPLEIDTRTGDLSFKFTAPEQDTPVHTVSVKWRLQ